MNSPNPTWLTPDKLPFPPTARRRGARIGGALLLTMLMGGLGCDSAGTAAHDGGPDATVDSGARPDGDAPHADAFLKDTAVVDAARVDSARPPEAGNSDTSTPPDTNVLDSIPSDTALPDTATPDSAIPDAALPDAPTPTFCTECVNIRVGRPLVARGPAADELDNPFIALPLPGGGWRGFSANNTTYAIDGADLWAMGGARTAVLTPGPAGSDNECGQWLNDVKVINGVVHGFIHWERECDYDAGQTHKSMAYGTSTDNGLTWSVQGQIITSTVSPQVGENTGEGDCHAVDGGDGYYYLYCLQVKPGWSWGNIVARAPATALGPGSWTKYYQGSFSQPGLGGEADQLSPVNGAGFIGLAVGRWTDHQQTIALADDQWFGGIKVSFSSDWIHFTQLDEPMIPFEATNWDRPAPTELYAYLNLLDPDDGKNTIDGGSFLLTHTYLEPGATFADRYLVFRDVWISVSPAPVTPQVGVALSRWHSAGDKDRWTTTAPVIGNFTSYAFEGELGYVMTRPHPVLPTHKLEGCVSSWPGHPDHLLTFDGTCAGEGYTRLRTVGWVYQAQQPDTVPLYRCYDSVQQNHFASTAADCEGLGQMEWLLGYALEP